MPRKQTQSEDAETTTPTTPKAPEATDNPTTAKQDSVYYHIGMSPRGPWREAVLNVPIGASPDALAQAAKTVQALQETFPLPPTAGINLWYNNAFVSAYLAVSTTSRLQAMLVAMGGKGVADPGAVILAWGQKYAEATVAEVEEKDSDYLDWLKRQESLDAYRIGVAVDAFRVLKPSSQTKQEANQ